MRLACQLGWVNVDQMLDQITPDQFCEWVAFLSKADDDEQKASATISDIKQRFGFE